MRRLGLAMLFTAGFGGSAIAQEPYIGSSSFGAQETLFRYDDLEPWKHGWKKQMPYNHGFHSFRPYNYHHVFGQTQTAAAYGQSMPYSQQWWHRYQSPSAQYNHLQGQPLMAMPQYNTQPAPVMGPPPGSYMGPPPPYGPVPGSAAPGPSDFAPAPMNVEPGYSQPGYSTEPMAIPAMPAPLMPVN